MNATIDSPIIFIGAGPANIFAALELLAQNVDPAHILIIEKGNSSFNRNCPAAGSGCRHCRTCNIVHGFGGAGMYSDGKLEVDRGRKFDSRTAARVFELMSQYGLELMADSGRQKVLDRLSEAQQLLAPCGLAVQDDFVSQHIGTDEIIAITRRMEQYLAGQRVSLLFNQEVCQVTRDRETGAYRVSTINAAGKNTQFTSRMVVAGIGKSSHHKFGPIFDGFEMETKQKPPILGIRYEFPVEAMLTISQGILKDPLIYWKTSSGDELTTYCTCHRGRVVPYFTGEILLLGGHALADDDQSVSNFGLAYIANSQQMAHTTGYSYSFAKLANAYGGNKPVIQTYGDFLRNTQQDEHKRHRTALKNYVYGNLNFVLPQAVADCIREFIQRLGQVDERFRDEDNILSAPVIEFVSPKMNISPDFESTNENLFLSGETSGQAYGIVTAAGTGIRIAEAIAGRI